ncbi:MAG: hypothetical protein H3Z52_07275 [archaeon]|nr:hypothetical protein [archaeon]MCP8320726.1 hypothetical protein [archaeon]
MLKIELGDLKDKSEDLAKFLEEKLKLKPSTEASSLVLDDAKSKVKLKKSLLKTYLKRYLHLNDLRKSYKVLVKEDELRLVALKVKEES